MISHVSITVQAQDTELRVRPPIFSSKGGWRSTRFPRLKHRGVSDVIISQGSGVEIYRGHR